MDPGACDPPSCLGHDPWKRYRLHPDHRIAGLLDLRRDRRRPRSTLLPRARPGASPAGGAAALGSGRARPRRRRSVISSRRKLSGARGPREPVRVDDEGGRRRRSSTRFRQRIRERLAGLRGAVRCRPAAEMFKLIDRSLNDPPGRDGGRPKPPHRPTPRPRLDRPAHRTTSWPSWRAPPSSPEPSWPQQPSSPEPSSPGQPSSPGPPSSPPEQPSWREPPSSPGPSSPEPSSPQQPSSPGGLLRRGSLLRRGRLLAAGAAFLAGPPSSPGPSWPQQPSSPGPPSCRRSGLLRCCRLLGGGGLLGCCHCILLSCGGRRVLLRPLGVERGLERGARGELEAGRRRDLDGATGLRVAPGTGLGLGGAERAESRPRDLVALLLDFTTVSKNAASTFSASALRRAGLLRNRFDQLGLVVMWFVSSSVTGALPAHIRLQSPRQKQASTSLHMQLVVDRLACRPPERHDASSSDYCGVTRRTRSMASATAADC